MQFKSVKQLILPLVKGGQKWQNITINGQENKPKLFLSNVQWVLLLLSIIIQFKLTSGISGNVLGYLISAFSISITLFMSLLVNIFDKFENTEFKITNLLESDIVRLKQKKNFFKRFISITSYLVVLSILIVLLCSITYFIDSLSGDISINTFTVEWSKINVLLTIKNILILTYRVVLNYFILNYLLLTLFVAGSAYEYYISELDRKRIE